jgi:hypothetical protein
MSQAPRRHAPMRRMGDAAMDIGALMAFPPGPEK